VESASLCEHRSYGSNWHYRSNGNHRPSRSSIKYGVYRSYRSHRKYRTNWTHGSHRCGIYCNGPDWK
jgi:hypothetical protein